MPDNAVSALDQLPCEHLPDALTPIIERYWQRLLEREQEAPSGLPELLAEQRRLAEQMALVWAASDYAANLCIEKPTLLLELVKSEELLHLIRDDYHGQLQDSLADLTDTPDEAGLKTLLRQFQQRQMLRLIWRDVCKLSSVRETAAEVSALAEACLDVTLAQLHRWAVQTHGEPVAARSGKALQLVVLGMGKLGASELNLSSDIDLIFAYPESGETSKGISCQQFFLRLGQQLVDALDAVTADGFVFRVDMRLRPYGSEGVLVCSFDAMENYYQSQGRDWERYAMIKARTVAGDREAGAELMQRLRPFSYRRYLDFSAFESLRSMKQQINKQVRKKGMSQDIKLGAGGIREVEFVVQALQMVHGGRDKRLQQTSLYNAMDVLREGEYLPADTVQALRNSYSFLRDLEHKLQGFANKQTQSLPASEQEQLRVALAMAVPDVRHADWSALMSVLEQHRDIVRQHFTDVIHTDEDDDDASRHDVDDDELQGLWQQELSEEAATKLLADLGYEAPAQTCEQLLAFRRDKVFQTLPAESRARFARFMPLLLATLATEKTPSVGFSRVMKMVESVARRTAYIVLLAENPGAMKQFVRLCTASPFVAEFLSQHPVLLDELLTVMEKPPEKSELQAELAQGLLRLGENSFEEQMEYLRYFKMSHTLQVAAAQITGTMTVMKVSDYLTFTAEAVLEQVLALCWQHLTHKHGYPVNLSGEHGTMDFAAIAYGKLGGIELSYISDLDLVFLHDGALDEDTVTSDGQKSINSREFYTRMAQRVITMLGTHTVSGKLYEVDMRLRPSGESGLLVSTLPAFEQYQQKDAWTWEKQALVRSRAVAGSAAMAADYEALRAKILSQPRDRAVLAEDVVKMRKRMREELTRKAGRNASQPPFVIKQGEGGIVDIEFMVQFFVLSQSVDCPALLTYSDNIRILEAAAGCGVLSEAEIERLIAAYLALRATLHEFALQYTESGPESRANDEAIASALAPLEKVQADVIQLWQKVFSVYDN
ncbi:bifunctional glutamine synthetase adenylyltransferase/deadenyltransferase [Pseudohongiella acticola]|jgi:[glutamine synthetase] adenylyltransferase / [glutamine synthetase]-adenylyl-L-tyrosine phosphorylase|uniref:Bifunctional glutamine synthetase adenylyltransferase/adenylyl-removing enzyme n=1 Tax=Pseudohongiella acticola TaxID=1524254 RepID=A0A1E8CKR1_9GAMM|nr:bifunctional [glutamate--ammonia ligase]-adenylyl-L-tyrosine phosphorylase/[glutamate--ammonia-ligase] adenylyltransferase [Pseudohongiella acticola]OFE13066.1 bifunctional glutamine synthetase adenylyltransferase/deadenyltransferase [Pseudohongiella acticola]